MGTFDDEAPRRPRRRRTTRAGATWRCDDRASSSFPPGEVRQRDGDAASDADGDEDGDDDFADQPWLREGFATPQEWVKHHGGEIEDVQIVDGVPVWCRRPWQRFQRTCRVLAMSATVGKVTMFLIILNTVLMAASFTG